MNNEITNPQTTLLSTYVTEETTMNLNLTEDEKKLMSEDEEAKKKRSKSAGLGISNRYNKHKNKMNEKDDDDDDDNDNNGNNDNEMDDNLNPINTSSSSSSSSLSSNLKSSKIKDKQKNKDKKEKLEKLEKMEDFLTGKYVRLGSGAYVGKLGRAVTRTVGNIYSISVLNIPGEKQGRHTSVTSSKLELINEFDLNDLEKSYIKMDKEILLNRAKKRESSQLQVMQQIINEKEKKAKLSLSNQKMKTVKDENGNDCEINNIDNDNENENENCNDENVNDENGNDENENENDENGNLRIPIIDSHKSVLDMYIRIRTGRYEGHLARVTGLIGKFRCSVKIVEELNVYVYRGTTVTSANFHPIDLDECDENEKAMIENDKNIRNSGGSYSSSNLKEKIPKVVFDVDLSGQYVRLLTGKYSGKIARVSTCQIGTSPCNVKVRSLFFNLFSFLFLFLFLFSFSFSYSSLLNPTLQLIRYC